VELNDEDFKELTVRVAAKLTSENPGEFVGRDLCNERSGNLVKDIGEVKWWGRGIGLAVVGQVLVGVFRLLSKAG